MTKPNNPSPKGSPNAPSRSNNPAPPSSPGHRRVIKDSPVQGSISPEEARRAVKIVKERRSA